MKQWILPAALSVLAMPLTANASYDPIKKADKSLAQMDKDHNGSVSMQEYFRPANHRFDRFDTNKNDVLEHQELYDYWKNKRKVKTDNINAWEGPTRSHFKKYDKNKDNEITRDEYLVLSKLRFSEIDLNEDKTISSQELRDHWVERRKEVDAYDFSEKDDD